MSASLRNLPSVSRILNEAAVRELCDKHSQHQVGNWVRSAVDACRRKIQAGSEMTGEETIDWIVAHVLNSQAGDRGQTLGRVINATGVLLHTNLGRSPLAERAIRRMHDAAGYANVELDLETGKRSRRGERVCQLLAELTGAEDALVVNNCAGATLLTLHALASGREVIVSRGQLVEIGGGFRLPEVFASASVTLKEVGTTNRTYVRDYENAVSEDTGAVLRVHRSNFCQTGFVIEPGIEELLDRKAFPGIPIIDDVGSGCLYDFSTWGLAEPNARSSVQAGADLVLFSGDKLFGGPQCGIIVGQKKWVDQLKACPMTRALRIDKITLAALEATVEIHLEGRAFDELPLLQMMTRSQEHLEAACRHLLGKLPALQGRTINVTACESPIGGGSMPGVSLSSFGLEIETENPDRLAKILRTGTPAIQPRISGDGLILDLRTIADEDLPIVVTGLKQALEQFSTDGKAAT